VRFAEAFVASLPPSLLFELIESSDDINKIDCVSIHFHDRCKRRAFRRSDVTISHFAHDCGGCGNDVAGRFQIRNINFDGPLTRQDATQQKFEHCHVAPSREFNGFADQGLGLAGQQRIRNARDSIPRTGGSPGISVEEGPPAGRA